MIKPITHPVLRLLLCLTFIMSAMDSRASLRSYSSLRLNATNGLPRNTVYAIVQDGDGYIWMGGTGGLCRYDGHEVASFSTERLGQLQVAFLSYDSKHDQLRLTTAEGNYYKMSPRTALMDTAKTGPTLPQAPRHVAQAVPGAIYQGRAGNYHFVAMPHSGTLTVIAPNGQRHNLQLIPNMTTPLEKQHLFFPALGKDGRIYIATYGAGLYIVDPHTWQIEHYSALDAQPLFGSDYLQAIFIDRSGNLWVSAENAGVACISRRQGPQVTYLLPAPQLSGYRANSIRRIYRETTGEITVVANDDKTYLLDPQALTLTYRNTLHGGVYARWIDLDGRVWRGTRGDCLYVGDDHYGPSETARRLEAKSVYGIAADNMGRVWIATEDNGLFYANHTAKGTLTFHKLGGQQGSMLHQYSLLVTREQQLLVGTQDGLYALDTRKKTPQLQRVSINDKPSSENVRYIMQAKDGQLWLSVAGNGVIHGKLSPDGLRMTATSISQKGGLSSNEAVVTLQDRRGDIWVCSEQGVTQLNAEGRNPRIHIWGALPLSDAYMTGALELDDGRLLLGTRNGVAVVTPEKQGGQDPTPDPLHITNLSIDGKAQYGMETDLSAQLSGQKPWRLSHDQNNLGLTLSTLSFNADRATLYQYWLEGYDKQWGKPTTEWEVRYDHLPPGHYTFHARALQAGKAGEEVALDIVVAQPWWNTWWAWTIYLLALGGIVWAIWHAWRRNFDMRQEMRLQREMTEMRLDFFTHITHEFRTPLSIISSCVDKLGQPETKATRSVQRATLQTAQRGTKRLLRLVNQLIEFRRMRTGQGRLSVVERDVVDFVRQICDDFRTVAAQKEVSLTFRPAADSIVVTFDERLMETMVYNLLSNAMKYTPQRGSVVVRIKLDGGKLHLTVDDSGPGISDEQQSVLFQPFMQGRVAAGGMGVGLYNAHAMALLHHGDLSYQRSTMLGGACFTLVLPAEADAYQPDEKALPASAKTTDEETDSKNVEQIREMLPEAVNDVTITVIEDDPDMQELIVRELSAYFKVKAYMDGEQALEGIADDKPALVVCDVMLPGMDGYQIVRKMKADKQWANTPVILLTALDDEAHQLKAYKAGADDFMTKPVNFRLLAARAIQLITWSRQRANNDAPTTDQQQQTTASDGDRQARQTAQQHAEDMPLVSSAEDKRFVERLNRLIAEHMSDGNLSADQLAETLMMGRNRFFGKVKETTGLSPNRYLLKYRMDYAAQLLAEGKLSVKEVASKVGFQDPSYFNKVFKRHYGISPSERGNNVGD